MASDAGSGETRPTRFDRAWWLAPLPFGALGVLEAQLVPWPRAAFDAALLFGLIAAHAQCYARWRPHAPGRILANEAMTRLWFAVYAILVAGLMGLDLGFVAPACIAWAGFTWFLHRAVLRGRGYAAAENAVLLGVFLAGLAALLVVA